MNNLEQPTTASEMIILFGVKHSGKSTIGRALSHVLSWPFHDLDDCIETETMRISGTSIRDFFRVEERKKFFDIETHCLENFLKNHSTPWILATGGGIIDNSAAIRIMPEKSIKIFLHNDPQVLFTRIMKKGLPPFISPEDPYGSFLKIYESRTSRYKNISDLIIDRVNDTIEQTIEKLITSYKEYLNARK